MYKPEPPAGWRLLDDFHSPGETVRYVRERADGWYDVVDVASYGGINDYWVQRSVERGIFEESADGSRPYIHTEMQLRETVIENADQQTAFNKAMELMRGGNGTSITGGL